MKWLLHACARCGGDVYIDRDIDGWFEQCLQCSHRRELPELQFRKPVGVGARALDWDDEEDDGAMAH